VFTGYKIVTAYSLGGMRVRLSRDLLGRMGKLFAVWIVLVAACSPKPTAADVCKKIEASGLASGCKEEKPGGLGASATERYVFDLPSVPGKGGQVLRFDREESFSSSAFTNAAALTGPHRYGSKKALVFVQANDGLSLEDGKKLKAIVDGL
jgi:hypothetical protein